ncbi:hypothetical protein [Chryseobacterium sp.]|uniref:hypothetical protein n=1 Tax=Chryseobacterium sp. TaxID=1871047 RepID=UPI00289FE337|nr:hypothetical protein [Chryseobacterium sp.]
MAKKTNEATPQNEEQLNKQTADNTENPTVLNNQEGSEDKIKEETETNQETQEVLSNEENSAEQSLEERIKAVEAREEETAEFSIKLLEKSAKLFAKQEELEAREKAVEEKELALKGAKPAEKTVGLEFEFEEEKYKFVDSAPQLISINRKGYSQKEIADDADLALQLIGGKSSLIIKI